MALQLFYVTNLVKNSNLNNQSHLLLKREFKYGANLELNECLKVIRLMSHKVIIKHQIDTNSHSVIYSTRNFQLMV